MKNTKKQTSKIIKKIKHAFEGLKHNFLEFKFIALIELLALLLVIIGIVGFVVLTFIDKREAITILIDTVSKLWYTLTIGVAATLFTKVVSDHIIAVKRNDGKLRSFGIRSIGGGRSSNQDLRRLFGFFKKYPQEIKLLLITGNGFFARSEVDIERCLKKSDCEIKILLLDTSNENQQYVIRAEEMCPQGHSYWFQIYEQSLKLLQELITKTKCSENRIKVRFYRDEYRYHYRLAKYHNANDSITTKLFMNVQPFNKDAVDVSIGFKGEHNDGIEGENFITLLDDGFDYLWDKYEHTEHRFDFSHAKEPEAEEVIND